MSGHDCVFFLLSRKNTTYSSIYISESMFPPSILASHDYMSVWVPTLSCTPILYSRYLFHNLIYVALSIIEELKAKSSFPCLAN